MKQIFFLLLLATAIGASSQDPVYRSVAVSDEQLVFGFHSDIWYGLPEEVESSLVNRGYSIFLFYDVPISTSDVGIAFGLGWRQQNLYSNAYPARDNLISQGNTQFYLVPSMVGLIPIEYSLNRMTLGYLTLPLEFRYRNRGETRFKISAGFYAGVLLSEFTKYRGSDYMVNPAEKVKWKRYGIPNALPYTYGLSFRLGVQRWGLSGYYQLPSTFIKGKGPDVRPLSIGLTYNPV